MPKYSSVPWWRIACRYLSLALLALGLSVIAPAGYAAQSEVIGNATKLKPEAGARLHGQPRALSVGSEVHRDEQVWTAAGARLDIRFVDGSSVTLGENARVKLDEFVYSDTSGVSSQVLRSVTGAIHFIGGAIDRSRTGATKLITPLATMTVRGTEFFAGPIDGAYGVFVYHGEVEVATSGGSVTLKDGEGTTLTQSRVAPTPPKLWPAAKIARAEKLVGF